MHVRVCCDKCGYVFTDVPCFCAMLGMPRNPLIFFFFRAPFYVHQVVQELQEVDKGNYGASIRDGQHPRRDAPAL